MFFKAWLESMKIFNNILNNMDEIPLTLPSPARGEEFYESKI
jgi:hypothetical protein